MQLTASAKPKPKRVANILVSLRGGGSVSETDRSDRGETTDSLSVTAGVGNAEILTILSPARTSIPRQHRPLITLDFTCLMKNANYTIHRKLGLTFDKLCTLPNRFS
jgi:hypothetical protein